MMIQVIKVDQEYQKIIDYVIYWVIVRNEYAWDMSLKGKNYFL